MTFLEEKHASTIVELNRAYSFCIFNFSRCVFITLSVHNEKHNISVWALCDCAVFISRSAGRITSLWSLVYCPSQTCGCQTLVGYIQNPIKGCQFLHQDRNQYCKQRDYPHSLVGLFLVPRFGSIWGVTVQMITWIFTSGVCLQCPPHGLLSFFKAWIF